MIVRTVQACSKASMRRAVKQMAQCQAQRGISESGRYGWGFRQHNSLQFVSESSEFPMWQMQDNSNPNKEETRPFIFLATVRAVLEASPKPLRSSLQFKLLMIGWNLPGAKSAFLWAEENKASSRFSYKREIRTSCFVFLLHSQIRVFNTREQPDFSTWKEWIGWGKKKRKGRLPLSLCPSLS